MTNSAPLVANRMAFAQSLSSPLFCIALTSLVCTHVHADDRLPAPSNVEDAKSDILQLDRDISALEQRVFLTEKTTILFNLPAKTSQSVSNIQLILDGQPIVNSTFSESNIKSLKKGGMAPLWEQNLSMGKHRLEVSLFEVSSNRTIAQSFNFEKKSARTFMALQLIERPLPDETPIKLIVWNRND